jgi:hypothetical protein
LRESSTSRLLPARSPELGAQDLERRVGADRLEVGVGFEAPDVSPAAFLALAEAIQG